MAGETERWRPGGHTELSRIGFARESACGSELLAKAQVKFGFYSDGLDSATDLKKALKKAIDGGLPRSEAIRALTLSVAEMYGVADRLGSVDKGKIANLVVTRGDAFEEKTTVEYVFIDGRDFQPSKEPPDTKKPPEEGMNQ